MVLRLAQRVVHAPGFRKLNLRAFQRGFEYGSTAQVGTSASLEMDPHLIYSED